MKQLTLTFLPIISGLPLMYCFYFLIKLKLNYWKSNKIIFNSIFDVFSLKMFSFINNDTEKKINKITGLLYILIVLWVTILTRCAV